MKLKAFTLIIPFIFLLSSCQDKDPCEDIICENAGVCNTGICECPEWYEGSSCEQRITPSKVVINTITVTSFYDLIFLDTQGNPDLYLALVDKLGNTRISTKYNDCTNDLDYTFNLDWDLGYNDSYTILKNLMLN